MKKVIFLLLIAVTGLSCKKEVKPEAAEDTIVVEDGKTEKQRDGLTLLKGEFVYYADAAVLQTHREMYGVVIDQKMHELDEMAKSYQKEATDFVQIEIRGKVIPKPEGEEGWPYRVEIKEILNVSAANPEGSKTIKLGNK
ncbi:MAG: hypothetical protein KC469_06775 [Flavobacteriaceae bacterium]|nr:hypothetical protein [Flavobacteriaceae bacterium]